MRAALVLFISFLSISAYSQVEGANGPPQVGAYIGNLLPNGLDGVDEIITLWGLRYSRPFENTGYYEFSGVFGNTQGVNWQSVSASLRMDVPIETLTGLFYLGLDYSQYKGADDKKVAKGGAHVGGGIMSLIGGGTHARFDMKLNSKPGTSLYFAIGIVIDL